MKTIIIVYTTAVAIACVCAAAVALQAHIPAPSHPCAVVKNIYHCHKLP
jgi:hypothetical protein